MAGQKLPSKLPDTLLSSIKNSSSEDSGYQIPITPKQKNSPKAVKEDQSASKQPRISVTDIDDQYAITPAKFEQYRVTFNGYQNNGFIPGSQAALILSQSALDQQVLANVWKLADADMDGALNVVEFAVAMHIIHLKLAGVEVPTELPQTLLNSILPYANENVPIQIDLGKQLPVQDLVTNIPIPENDPLIQIIMTLPDPLEGIVPGIDTSFDLSLFQMDPFLKNTGLPSIVNANMDFQPLSESELSDKYNVIKKVVTEYDPSVDINNVLTKISNVSAATKVLQSSEPQITQIKVKLEHEFSLGQELKSLYQKLEIESNELEKDKEIFTKTLLEMHEKISKYEEELKRAKEELAKEIDWLNSAPSTYLALVQGTSPPLLQIQTQQIKNEIQEVRKNRAIVVNNVEEIKKEIVKANQELIELANKPPETKKKTKNSESESENNESSSGKSKKHEKAQLKTNLSVKRKEEDKIDEKKFVRDKSKGKQTTSKTTKEEKVTSKPLVKEESKRRKEDDKKEEPSKRRQEDDEKKEEPSKRRQEDDKKEDQPKRKKDDKKEEPSKRRQEDDKKEEQPKRKKDDDKKEEPPKRRQEDDKKEEQSKKKKDDDKKEEPPKRKKK